jgi:hypothetical protein
MDPWGNAYDYRYRILNAATTSATIAPYTTWLSPEFLLVSCGAKYKESIITGTPHVPLIGEYWDASSTSAMVKAGTIPSTYFENSILAATGIGQRADNITNWSGR